MRSHEQLYYKGFVLLGVGIADHQSHILKAALPEGGDGLSPKGILLSVARPEAQ